MNDVNPDPPHHSISVLATVDQKCLFTLDWVASDKSKVVSAINFFIEMVVWVVKQIKEDMLPLYLGNIGTPQ
jgi:hypothetical protein